MASLQSGVRPPLIVAIGSNLVRIIVVTLFVVVASGSSAQTIEQQTLTHLEKIKAVRADADENTVAGYNKSMDEAWKFFDANKAAVLPVLRRELTLELRAARPNDMLLLDVGYYLRTQGDTSDKELAKEALFKLDPTSKVVYLNHQQLFEFAYAVATEPDPRVLPFIDRAFLRQKLIAYVPQHALTLNETLVCVFLYGVHGQTSEAHLKSLLKDKAVTRKVIEILIWIGTPESVTAVRDAMVADRSFETFGRGTSFMMKAGGREGRAAMLGLTPRDFDAQSREYFQKVRPLIEANSYEMLRKQFSRGGDFTPLGEDVVRKRLADMYKNYGKDDITDPRAILDSTLPRTFLINELWRIRARMFHRLSDEALHDVLATNSILSALYYREK